MTEVTLKGSCLCGANSYEVQGDAARFYHCHCKRCRKATGSGHASNILLQPATVSWTGDPNTRTTYKVPEAERFGKHFCNVCGAPLPRDAGASGLIVLPAGSLDSEVDIKPQARIFLDSSASWSCGGEEQIPGFPEYPT